jgi:F0F1-type ATP synthase assembly protein I
MTTATKSVKGPAHKANKILLWSSLVALLCTGLAFLLDHPMRVPPAALGALATPVAFVSLCVVVWRLRHH